MKKLWIMFMTAVSINLSGAACLELKGTYAFAQPENQRPIQLESTCQMLKAKAAFLPVMLKAGTVTNAQGEQYTYTNNNSNEFTVVIKSSESDFSKQTSYAFKKSGSNQLTLNIVTVTTILGKTSVQRSQQKLYSI